MYVYLASVSGFVGIFLQIWQGYGGNIYFDAVRCKSMRINSSKSGKSRKEGITKRWKSKSCYPLNRRDDRQSHFSSVCSSPKDIPEASIDSLGSLRMRSACKDKKCKKATCRHTESPRQLPGKICKGFSEKMLKETFQRLQENGDYRFGKDPLAVSGGHGGQVGDSFVDPIDKVRQFNTQGKGRDFALNLENGFPALLTGDSSFFSHGDYRSSAAVANGTEPFIKLPVLGRTDATHKTSKAGKESSVENTKQEPRAVLIIPFGACDDPVDGESDSKRKAEKKEKPSIKSTEDGIKTTAKILKDVDKLPEELGINSSVKDDGLEKFRKEEDSGCSLTHPSDGRDSEKSPGSACPVRQGLPDFQLKREISNLSLSNYLRAVPTRGAKEQTSPSAPRSSAMVPKMSYTNRSRALPAFYMVNNYQSGYNPQRVNGSHVYGGYFPTTGTKESKVFFAEISTISEQNTLNGDNTFRELSKTTRSSNSKKAYTNSQIPKQSFVKASCVTRKSFSRQGVSRSPRGNDALRNSDKNLLHVPLTGHQFSRLNGIRDR